MSRLRNSALLALMLSSVFAHSTVVKRVIHPAISPDGSTLVVAYQGDLWSLPASGGTAHRLTVNPSHEELPHWTPDGKRIFFTSDRYGSRDIFSMTPTGTDLKRLNFDSSQDYPYSISADGRTIYGYTTQWGRGDLFSLGISDGDLVRLTMNPMEIEYQPSPTEDGKQIVFCTGGSGGTWRRPLASGSNTGEIWIADNTQPLSNMRQLTKNEANDIMPLVRGNTIYFISNRSGWPNLWKMNLDGSRATQLTKFTEGTMRWPSVDAKGTQVVFEFESELYSYNVALGVTSKIEVDVPDDERTNPETQLDLRNGANAMSVSPDGRKIAFSARGEVFVTTEHGGQSKKLTSSYAMDTDPSWLSDSSILFMTGRNVKRELWTVDLSGKEMMLVEDPKLDVGNAQLAPDGKSFAYHRGENEIWVYTLATHAKKLVSTGHYGENFNGETYYSWSPDSQYLVVKDVTDRGSTIVNLVEVATAKQTPVAWCARDTSAPKFLPNASAIYFQSSELSESNLYIVDLVSPEVKFVEDDLDSALNPLKKPDTKPKLPAVTIQTKGIAERMRQLSTAPTFVSQATPDSKSILAFAGGAWVSINVATGASSPIASLASGFAPIQFDKNGSKLYTIGVGGTMGSVNLATMSTAPIPFSASYSLNLRKDEEALFKEIWWAMDRFYYAPDMNNRNWPGIRDKYAAIVPFANDHDDFYAMMGEMMEELNSSHLGATAPDSAPAAGAETTGLLGVDWNPARLALGEYVVSSVLRGSPAAHPQMELRVGDVVRSVNGVTPSATNPMAKLLTGSTGKRVVLQVSRGGKEVTVTIKPTSMAARTALNYDDWVLSNREFVDKISGGKIGYHHYAAMNDASQNKFLREVRTQGVGKVGFIIDVRYNGGGSTAHKALGVLIKTPWLIRTRRDAPDAKLSENLYRGDTLELPSTLLINQYSFSNAEIFAEGFKRLKVGPVIGERTAGGVIGTSAYSLWDGGSIRMPASGAYTITMENLERNGRKPDLPVIWDPNAYLNGRDVVLETAVKELLKKAKQNP